MLRTEHHYSTIQRHLNIISSNLGAFRKLEMFVLSHGRLVPLVIGPHGLPEQPAGVPEAADNLNWVVSQKQVDDTLMFKLL